MKKILGKSLAIFVLVSTVASLASAQYLVPGQPGSNSGPIFAPGSGRGPGGPGGGFPGGPGGGPGWGHGPDHGPGHGPGPMPGQPYPSYPPPPAPYPNYPPPPAPGYNDVYGPNRTVRWQNMGSYVAQKIIETNVVIPGNGQFVNELFLTAVDNPVQINSALVYLVNGQVVELRGLLIRLDRNQQVRQPLDYRSSLRVDRIELRIESPAIFGGSRGSLQAQLGLAF